MAEFYFEGVVEHYLRANRRTFLNSEFFLQLDAGIKSPPKGRSWYVDFLAIELASDASARVWMCECSFSKNLQSLRSKVKAWEAFWDDIEIAIRRDASVPSEWPIGVWLFIPEEAKTEAVTFAHALRCENRVTAFEETLPWKFPSWNRTFANQEN